MVYDVRGKTIVITGAAQGIGRATAELAASKGANLALYDRLDDVLSKTASEILKNHPAIKVVHKALDLTDLANVRAMLEHAGDYDVVCNIAGMFDSDGQFMSTATEFERWKRMHDLNTTSLAYANQIAIAHFKAKGKKGAIVNIGSTAGLAPVPFMPIYAAGKSFVIHLSRCLGDLAPQIRVNAGG